MKQTFFKDITAADLASLNLSGLGDAPTGKVISIDGEPEQLSPWKTARLGKITGSNFGKVKYARNGKDWSETTETYLAEIIWEHVTGLPASRFTGNAATEWGNEHEDAAIAEYEKRTRTKIQRGKFYALKGHTLIGCTPDGVNRKKGLEVKCPYGPKAHFKTILRNEIPDEYIDQVRGHCLVTGKEHVEFVTFDPRIEEKHLRLHCIPYEHEPHEIEELHHRLAEFEQHVFDTLKRLKIKPRL